MTQALAVVGPHLKDEDFTFHVHNATCKDRKRKDYADHQDDWNEPHRFESIEQIVRFAFDHDPAVERDWEDFEDRFKFFECVNTDDLAHDGFGKEDPEEVVEEAPVVAPKPVAVEVEQVVTEPAYRVSGTVTVADLAKAFDLVNVDEVVAVLKTVLKLTETNGKPATGGTRGRKRLQGEDVYRQFPHLFAEVKTTMTDPVNLSIPGRAARLVNLTGGTFKAVGRGDQYNQRMTIAQALDALSGVRTQAEVIGAKDIRTAEDWGDLKALDVTAERIAFALL